MWLLRQSAEEGTWEIIIVWSHHTDHRVITHPLVTIWPRRRLSDFFLWIWSDRQMSWKFTRSISGAQAWLPYGCGSWTHDDGGRRSRPAPRPPRGPRSPSRSVWTSSTWSARTWPSSSRSCLFAAPSGCAGWQASLSRSSCWSWQPSCQSPEGRTLELSQRVLTATFHENWYCNLCLTALQHFFDWSTNPKLS